MDTGSNTPARVRFGRFQVSPHRRELLADGRPVQIGGRAFDVPHALIDAQGSVVSKNARMAESCDVNEYVGLGALRPIRLL
jgi:DNA-binding winged helix-turn-helix (wHTH) protein